MYNLNHLKTFIRVADLGSFNKAAEEAFLSPNAVMNQISNLENELNGVKLLDRTNKGCKLTQAGKVFYEEALLILETCERSKNRIIRNEKDANRIRFVVSFDDVAKEFYDLWKEVHIRAPELRLEIVTMPSDFKLSQSLWSNFNEYGDISCDIISYDGTHVYEGQNYYGFKLKTVPLRCLVSSNHPLAQKETLTFDDLAGCQAVILTPGWGQKYGDVVNHIRTRHPEISLTPKTYFNADTYNDCANDNIIVLSFWDLSNVHPFTTSVPMVEDFSADVGLTVLYPPTPAVAKLFNVLEEILAE